MYHTSVDCLVEQTVRSCIDGVGECCDFWADHLILQKMMMWKCIMSVSSPNCCKEHSDAAEFPIASSRASIGTGICVLTRKSSELAALISKEHAAFVATKCVANVSGRQRVKVPLTSSWFGCPIHAGLTARLLHPVA
jgi:hypothetical protein